MEKRKFDKKHHRGFTITELIIVIAVISVLCAVLIPAFSGLIKSANNAAMVSAARNLNLAIIAEGGNGNARVFMRDAVKFALDLGCSIEQLTPNGDSALLWDRDRDLFCVYDGNDFCYPAAENNIKARSSSGDRVVYTNYWCVYSSAPQQQSFSVYWASDQAFEGELHVGFDAGDNDENFTLNCVNCNGVILIYTNGQDINANGGEIHHYGETGTVCIKSSQYHEYGNVNKVDKGCTKCTLYAHDGSDFKMMKSAVIQIVGENSLTAHEGARFLPEPQHVCDFGQWVNAGEDHIRYCKGCDKVDSGCHSDEPICDCGYTELSPGLYLDDTFNTESDKCFISWESLIDDGYITATVGQANYTDMLKKYNKNQCTLVISNDVKDIGYALKDFKGLACVVIPYGVTKIDSQAFSDCTNLETIYLPLSLTKICEKAFISCTSLKKITVPGSVKKIYKNAFAGCSDLVVDCSAFSEEPSYWETGWNNGLKNEQIIFKNKD